MSTRRKQMIAAQAAAVAVLVLIVYAALLAPDGTGPLSGIEAPGGEEQAQVDGPDDRGNGGNGTGSKSGGGTGSPGAGATGGAPSGASGTVGGPPGSAATDTRFVNAPRDDQYNDTVKALLEKVGGPAPPGE